MPALKLATLITDTEAQFLLLEGDKRVPVAC